MNWEKTVDTLMGRGPAAFGLRAPGTRRLAVLAYHAIEEPRLFARHLDYVGRLFEEESNPIVVLKWKETLDFLEDATDCCEDVANVIEGVMVKHG